jgi:nucleoside phosphorylase
MTRIAIIAAMPVELKPLTRGWRHSRSNGVDLWRWSFDGGEWIAACAGAGVERAARALAEVEESGELDSVISTGWAGALRDELVSGQAYDVSCVIDAKTGERFLTSCVAPGIGALKGHGFSRAAETQNNNSALAAEGMLAESETIPQGLKPRDLDSTTSGTTEVVPFQNEIQNEKQNNIQNELRKEIQNERWLVTNPKVANAAEKQRLASTYQAALVDMEAAAIARLARMRGIPFCCIKGISDGYNDNLPDFNRFISKDGQFQLLRFVFFSLLRPWHWRALIRMGENSRKAARSIAASVLDLLDESGNIRKLNGYPKR